MRPSTTAPAKRYVELIPEKGHPFEIPFGWYFVGYSDELKVGRTFVISCFWQEWVLFRDELGHIGMIDPYCPHLGAHIGFGGKVDGEMVRCPFHAWGFDSNGYCRDVPYTKKMPPVFAKGPVIKSTPVIECNNIIWAWYHPLAVTPIWGLETAPETMSNDWIEYEKVEFEVNTSIQDIAENTIDYSHFKYVHGHTSTLSGHVRHNGIYRHVFIEGNMQVIDRKGKADSCHYSIDFFQKGPGQCMVHYRREIELIMMFLMTPLTNEKTILRFAFTHRKYPKDSYEYKAAKKFILEKIGSHGKFVGVHADIPIWNNKIYRKQPLLCAEDGPIMQYRSWFKQFYAGTV